MRPLVINESVKRRVADVIEHARRNVVTLDEMKKRIKTGNAVGEIMSDCEDNLDERWEREFWHGQEPEDKEHNGIGETDEN